MERGCASIEAGRRLSGGSQGGGVFAGSSEVSPDGTALAEIYGAGVRPVSIPSVTVSLGGAGEARLQFTVTEADTASALGSGDLPVLGTPRLLAWLEAASCAAVGLADGQTSVGTKVVLDHVAACGVGDVVDVDAMLIESNGRLRRFQCIATSGSTLLASAEVTRVEVNAARFMARLGR
jgi:fluoroacetyl-CoA thioesterase